MYRPREGRARGPRILRRKQQPSEMRVVQFSLSEEAYQALQRVAGRKGSSLPDALGDAISLADWVTKVEKEGGKVLSKHGTDVRELVRS